MTFSICLLSQKYAMIINNISIHILKFCFRLAKLCVLCFIAKIYESILKLECSIKNIQNFAKTREKTKQIFKSFYFNHLK